MPVATLSFQLRRALRIFAFDYARHVFCSHVVVGGFDDYSVEILRRVVHEVDYTRGRVRAQVENDVTLKIVWFEHQISQKQREAYRERVREEQCGKTEQRARHPKRASC